MLLTGTPAGGAELRAGNAVSARLSAHGQNLASLEMQVVARKGGYQFSNSATLSS